MKQTLLTLITLLALCRFSTGQATKFGSTTWPDENTKNYKQFLDNIEKANADKYDKKIRKEYTEIISDKNESLINSLKDDNFLFDGEIYDYLHAVFNEILKKNSLPENQFHFFVNRSPEVNAYTYEDGTIVCNIGLLGIIETENQLAMVLCHELAHYLLDHTNTEIVKSIERFNSPELLAQVKEIKKEKYNTKKQLESLLMTDLFNNRKHNRFQESSADSLGLILFKNTAYGDNAVARLFDLLDAADSIITKTGIKDFCKQENIAADEKWFTIKKKMSFGEAPKKEMLDTLKTHPDCRLRKLRTEAYFSKNPKAGSSFIIADANRIKEIKKTAAFEVADYSNDKERLSLYLYQLIQNDAAFPGTPYIKTEICKTLINFCVRLKKHSLAAVIDVPYTTENPKDEYAKLLRMIDGCDLGKMKELILSYYEKNKAAITLNEEQSRQLAEIKTY